MLPQPPLLLLLLLSLKSGHGCPGPELDRELVLAKVRALFLDALGPPAVTEESGDPGVRRLPRRHAQGGFVHRGSQPREEEDVSQAILFPTTEMKKQMEILCRFSQDWRGAPSLTEHSGEWLRRRGPRLRQSGLPSPFPLSPAGASCGDEPAARELTQEAKESLFTYVFQPSKHTRSRQVTSAHLWFHTGLDRQGRAASNSSGPLLSLLALSSGVPMAVPMSLGHAPSRWAVLHLATSALPLLTHPVLVLQLRCPLCSCSARPEATPFLVAHTRARPPSGGERARRSTPPLPWPWSPAALRLLQRSPEEPAAHADCHRAALNISFQELGWDRWIVHPPSFIFHYCHGGCGLTAPPDLPLLVPGAPPTPAQPLSLVPGARPCCAALPGTMRPLRVRTTSDGGYSFKYETVPNLLTQHCACI